MKSAKEEMLGFVRQQAADDVAQQRAVVVLDRVFSNDAEGREQRIAHAEMLMKERESEYRRREVCLYLCITVGVCVDVSVRPCVSVSVCLGSCVCGS
jgi:hypothetical protein